MAGSDVFDRTRQHKCGQLSVVAVAVLEDLDATPRVQFRSGGEGRHLQGYALPQLLGLLASL